MKRAELEKHLGELVEIKLFDNEVIRGCLRKTGDEMFKNNPNLYIPMNFYFMTEDKDSLESSSCLFRASHVKKLIRV